MDRRRWTWLAWLFALGAVVACVVLGAGVVRADHRREFDDARALWAARGPSHYRMQSMTGEGCLIDVEVRHHTVLQVFHEDRCVHPARTVPDLFSLIERGQVSVPCFFAGCACRIDVETFGVYDPTYGYPTMISLRSVRGPNWKDKAYWSYLLQNGHDPGCNYKTQSEVARMLIFTPLP